MVKSNWKLDKKYVKQDKNEKKKLFTFLKSDIIFTSDNNKHILAKIN